MLDEEESRSRSEDDIEMLDRSRCARAHVLLQSLRLPSSSSLRYIYMPKDRVPLLPPSFPVHRAYSLILLTG